MSYPSPNLAEEFDRSPKLVIFNSFVGNFIFEINKYLVFCKKNKDSQTTLFEFILFIFDHENLAQ